MMRRIALAMALCFAFNAAWAGTPAKTTDKAAGMAAMKAEMAKCAVCKNMAAHFDELAPVMTMEVVNLDNGVVIDHEVTDPSKVALFHSTCDAMGKAGEAAMKMTDAQAKTELCSFCQEMRSAGKAGARFSKGKTKTGDMMVLTSDDPKVQGQLTALGQKCAMMAGDPQASR